MTGAWYGQAVYVAAKLGIVDLLTDGPRTVTDLAHQTGTNPDALRRVLRALAK
jgi:DNA-binding IclR family transcriptional regulator